MKQLIYIHGWTCFPDSDTFCKVLATRKYKPFENKKKRIDRLIWETEGQCEVFNPIMPNKYNADYAARKIWFEKTFHFFNDEDLILVGHSLWWMFLLKYLWENWFPKKIKQLHLVATVIDGSNRTEDKQYFWDFEFDLDIISKLDGMVEDVFIYHSTDDPTVPYSHAEKIKTYLPEAKLITLTDRGHIRQAEFPELLENILQ